MIHVTPSGDFDDWFNTHLNHRPRQQISYTFRFNSESICYSGLWRARLVMSLSKSNSISTHRNPRKYSPPGEIHTSTIGNCILQSWRYPFPTAVTTCIRVRFGESPTLSPFETHKGLILRWSKKGLTQSNQVCRRRCRSQTITHFLPRNCTNAPSTQLS